jgi:hypothetical protein
MSSYWTLTDCNYDAIANSHILQLTTVRTKSSQIAVSSPVVASWRIPTMSFWSRQHFHPRVRVPRNSWPHFAVQIRDSPNLEGQVTIFISPRNRVAQLYSQVLGSLSVASEDSREVFEPTSTRTDSQLTHWSNCPAYNTSTRTAHKTSFLCCSFHCCVRVCWDAHVIDTQPMPSNGCCITACLAIVA